MREFIAPHFGTEITYKLPLSNNVQTLPKALIKKLIHLQIWVFWLKEISKTSL